MDDNFVKKTCKPGTRECCRYLMMGADGWRCAKLIPELKAHFDDRVARNDMNAIGDNCEGVQNAEEE